MYKIISLGYPIYTGDDDTEFLISALVCSNCGKIWSMSRTECIFCGNENPHIYQCRKCGKKYSITRVNQKCCNEKLIKICMNENCITNTNIEVKNFFDNLGGVFEIGKSGATLNEMRCKSCGHKINEYKSILVKLVNDINSTGNDNICYMHKVNENKFEVKYNGEKSVFSSIEVFVNNLLT